MTGAVGIPAEVAALLTVATRIVTVRDRVKTARDSVGSSPERSPALAAFWDVLDAEVRGLDEQLAALYRLVELAEDGLTATPAGRDAVDDLRRLTGQARAVVPIDTGAVLAGWRAGGEHAPTAQTVTAQSVHEQVTALPDSNRRLLALADPDLVGNLLGVPWETRALANAVAVRRTLHREQIAGTPWSPRIGRLETMCRRHPDPAHPVTAANDHPDVRRTFLAFAADKQGRMIELVGQLGPRTEAVGVYVPGTGTNLDMSHVNTEVAVDLVAASGGRLAMCVFLDGEFPQDLLTESGQMRYAEHTAPRLVAFCAELDGEIARRCPGAQLTLLGHSYGGRIVGTAERLGLGADRVLYAESPDAGVGVRAGSDWRAARAVQRYSMTAPGDPIELVQMRFGRRHAFSHSDIGNGVIRLDTGRFADGTPVFGPRGHGGVFELGSDSQAAMLAVLLGGRATAWRDREIRARHVRVRRGTDGRLLPALVRLAVGQWWRRSDDPYGDARIEWEAEAREVVVQVGATSKTDDA